jgi:formylglycine-generating enzyme required for sulfatase activity
VFFFECFNIGVRPFTQNLESDADDLAWTLVLSIKIAGESSQHELIRMSEEIEDLTEVAGNAAEIADVLVGLIAGAGGDVALGVGLGTLSFGSEAKNDIHATLQYLRAVHSFKAEVMTVWDPDDLDGLRGRGAVLDLLDWVEEGVSGATDLDGYGGAITDLIVPDLEAEEGYAQGEAFVRVENTGTRTAPVRIWGYIYGPTAGGLKLLAYCDNPEEMILASGESRVVAVPFSTGVPSGGLDPFHLDVRAAFGPALVSTMAGDILEKGGFLITGSDDEADLAEGIESETIDEGVITEGGTAVSSYTVDSGWWRVTFRLFTDSGDLDLHVFDDHNRHVGWDHSAGLDEVEIPDARYSGSETTPEEISVRKRNDVTYRIEIRDHETGKLMGKNAWAKPGCFKNDAGSAFTVQAVLVPASGAVVLATPDSLEFGIDALSERTGVDSATGLRVNVVNARDAGGDQVSTLAFEISLETTAIEPGATTVLDLTVDPSVLDGVDFPVEATIRIHHDDGVCDLNVRILAVVPQPTSELSQLDVAELTMVPASAHAAGAEDTRWLTDLTIYNPGGSVAIASIFFLPAGADNARSRGVGVEVLPGDSVALADVVEDMFEFSSATGAILIGADQPLLITSRTYNNAADGTFGQYVPGLSTSVALGQGDEARLIQLTRNADFRTNIGFANATGQALSVTVDLHRKNGDRIKQKTYTVEPYGYLQKNDIIGTNVNDAYAIVSSSTAGAKYFTYASVVDNDSGDPVLVLPSTVATTGTDVFVPGAAHVAGAAGTNWRTDLEVHNPGSTQAGFKVSLLKKNLANTSPVTRTFSLGAGQSMRYEDVLDDVFGYDGSAGLRVTPTAGKVMVSARTYNDLPSGTFGQFIPGMTIASAAVAEDQEGRLIQLSRSRNGSRGFRTNVGFVNPTPSSMTVKVEMFDGDGTRLGARSYTLQPYEYDQVDDVLGKVTSGDVDNGFAVVTTQTSGGRFFAYASVVDNRSGDPVYMGAAGGSGALPPPPTQDITITLPGGVTMELVYIEPGTFMMGSPTGEWGWGPNEDLHQVTLTHGYYLGKYEVTQEQWEAVMGTNPAHGYGVGDDYPVYYISWNDVCGGTTGSDCAADSFIGRLNAQQGATTFRMPTEAEWERAARAGTQTEFSFDTSNNSNWDTRCGNFPEADAYMWWCGNNDPNGTKEVGSKQSNPYGLFDMHGNLFEWVADWYTSSLGTSAQTDPTGPTSGSARVLRGGLWYGYSQYCRSADRSYGSPSSRGDYGGIGVRLARSLE